MATVDALNTHLKNSLGTQVNTFAWKRWGDLQKLDTIIDADGTIRVGAVDWKPILSERWKDRWIMAVQDVSAGLLCKDYWIPWMLASKNPSDPPYYTTEPATNPTWDLTNRAIAHIRAQREQFEGKDLRDVNHRIAVDILKREEEARVKRFDLLADEINDKWSLFGQPRLPGTKTYVSLPTPGISNDD